MTQNPLAADSLSEEQEIERQVREYLLNHPDFFENNPDLIANISLPHESGNAVSLVERQVTVLRERNMEMRHRLNNMLETARENDKLFDRTKRLVLGLLETTSLQQLVETLYNSLKSDFGIEFYSLKLISDAPECSGQPFFTRSEQAQQGIGSLLRSNRPLCGILRKEELAFLFGEQADQIGSVAAIPLGHGKTIGVLALGNSDPHFYRSSMGTLFLSHIADILNRMIPRLLK